MAGKPKYGEGDRARAYVTLLTLDWNIKGTARETGIPQTTIRRWAEEFRVNPPDVDKVTEVAEDYVVRATRVRDAALAELERKIPQATPAQLVSAVGLLNDQIRVAEGLATSRSETVHTLPSADEIRATLGAVFQQALESAKAREGEIIDAEFTEEQSMQELPAAS